MKLPTLHCLQIMLLGLLPLSQATAGWRMETVSEDWHIAGFENALDLSGIAAANATQCLVGSDESFYILFVMVAMVGKDGLRGRRRPRPAALAAIA